MYRHPPARGRQVRQPLPPPPNEGNFDSHAFSAAATLELLGFKPFRNLSAPEEPPVGGDVGLVVGIGSPCDFMQLRNDANALEKPLNPPPPPNPPPDGRSDAQALLAFSNVLLLPDEPPNPPPPNPPPPPKPPPGAPDGRVVGTFTPCCRRQLRYALKPDEDELPAAELPDVAPQPATTSAASPKAAATHTIRPPRLPGRRTRTCISSPLPRRLQQDKTACRPLRARSTGLGHGASDR
jgi:hypothetical protein